jgi:hypothetical protein
LFKLNIIKKYKLYQLPKKVFIEKFLNIIMIYLLNKNKYKNKKIYNKKYNKLKYFKYKSYILNRDLQLYKKRFYNKMYNLYFY